MKPSRHSHDGQPTEFFITHGDEGPNSRLAMDGVLDDCVKFLPNPGTVLQLTEDHTFRTGVHENIPAMFLSHIRSIRTNDVGADSASRKFLAATLTKNVVAVCIGLRGYVIETSAFVTAEYSFGEPLTAITNDSDQSLGGKLTNSGSGKDGKVKKFSDPVVGVLTLAPSKNHNGVETMQVITGWLPGEAKN